MLVTLSGIVTLVRLLHLKNVQLPMFLTLSGISTPARLVHQENAESPILVTPSGIVTLVRLLQLRSASLPILVTPSGMTTSPPGPLYVVKTPFSTTKSPGLLMVVTSCVSFFRVLISSLYRTEMSFSTKNPQNAASCRISATA